MNQFGKVEWLHKLKLFQCKFKPRVSALEPREKLDVVISSVIPNRSECGDLISHPRKKPDVVTLSLIPALLWEVGTGEVPKSL